MPQTPSVARREKMRTRLTLHPGDRGAKQLHEQYGEHMNTNAGTAIYILRKNISQKCTEFLSYTLSLLRVSFYTFSFLK